MRWLAAILTGAALTGCSHTSVPLPPPDATPEQVVATSLQALEATDCRTATALLTTGKHGSWCGRIRVTEVTVRSAAPDRGSPRSDRVRVPVTFVSHGGDSSFPDGPHSWAYILERGGPAERWLIADEGLG